MGRRSWVGGCAMIRAVLAPRRLRATLLAVLVALALAAVPASAAVPDSAPVPADASAPALAAPVAVESAATAVPAAERKLTAAMKRLVRMPGGPPGIAVSLRDGGEWRFLTAGVGDLETGARWRPNDHMRIASVAKAFSGATALSLVAAGRLSLSDRIVDLLPWLPQAWSEVTVAQALQHTSGLPDYSQSPGFTKVFSKNLHAYVSPRGIIDYVASEPLDFAPGSRYHYSNTDNVVIGLIAARLGGGTYSQVLRQRVLDPLRLPSTSLPVGFRLPAPHVEGYELDPPAPAENVTTLISMSGAWASGGIQSTVADLNRFVRGYVGRDLFGRAVQRQQLSFVAGESDPPGPGTNSAGLGIFRYRTACGTVFGHTGNLPGFTQLAAASLDGRRSITVSVNARVVPDARSEPVRAAFEALRRIETLAICAV